MAFTKDKDFNDRRDNAVAARQAMLERFRSRPPSDDPEVIARLEERRVVAKAREARRAEREATRKAEDERIAAEKLAFELAELERLEREAAEKAARDELLAAEQKAARDLRYANRKKKKKR